MMFCPVTWSFKRKMIFPILEIQGESPVLESEVIMLEEVFRMIEKARDLHGLPYPSTPPTSKSTITISFSLLFESEADINTFMKFIHKQY